MYLLMESIALKMKAMVSPGIDLDIHKITNVLFTTIYTQLVDT